MPSGVPTCLNSVGDYDNNDCLLLDPHPLASYVSFVTDLDFNVYELTVNIIIWPLGISLSQTPFLKTVKQSSAGCCSKTVGTSSDMNPTTY